MIAKIAKSAFNIALRSKAIPSMRSVACFNFSSFDKITKAQTKLMKAVEKESKFEEENYEEDASVKEFLEEHQMLMKQSDISTIIELHKKAGNNTVQIVFQSRSPQTDEEQPEEQEGQQQHQQTPEGEEETNQMQDYCDFVVYIVKPNGKALAYDCSTFDSEIQVNGVTLIEDVESHKQTNRYDRMITKYNGPEFSTLDERLQTSLVEYLKSVGVNEEVAAFIEHVSLDKEQRLYMKWLKDMHTFLA